ncbi:hypothetical protein PG995_002620 [Apiospora arundinis]|uniref:Zn(2)-C6 fungal-type domain-containing protein n=1 Tax=Apiospora arundinis TaxID=335852 RepID=A0ABR2J651_9PEZI
MERRYVPIRPAAVTSPTERQGQNPDGEQTSAPKRRRIGAACEECRSRKVACDGSRPSCTPCVDRKAECIYRLRKDGPRGPWLDHIELIERLSSAPEADALDLLRRLRESTDLSAVLSSTGGGTHDKARSASVSANRSLPSPAFTKLELELSSLHPIAYPRLKSIDIKTICQESEAKYEPRTGTGPETGAVKGNMTRPDHAPRLSVLTNSESPVASFAKPPFPVRGTSGSPSLSPAMDLKRNPSLCDSRLHQLRMDYWTRVPISDELAARVISSYLVREHPMLGLFDADLFITDLVERRLRFCTPFLLSALMFYACHLYAGNEPETLAIAHSFFAEAEMLWTSERASDSLATVAATQLLRMMSLLQSRDRQTVEFGQEGRLMACRMKLFGVAHTVENASHFAKLSSEWKRATAHTAWGVYNWLTLRGVYESDYDAIPYTPILPIPGENIADEVERFGVIWPAHPLPNYVGYMFGPLCKLWTIVQEVAVVYIVKSGTPVADRVPMSFPESKFQKLLAWSDTLASTFAYGNHSAANNLLFHMFFHGAVLNVFRPFQRRPHGYKMGSFASPDSFPTAAYTASLNQLKRLVVITHLHHPPIDRSPFLASGLVHLFCGLLKNVDDEEWKHYFELCLTLGSQLFTWYHVLGPILQGTLAMGLRDGALTSQEAQDMLKKYVFADRPTDMMEDIMNGAAFTLDLDLVMTAPVDAMTLSLAKRFDDLVLFSEFAHVDGQADSRTQ